MMNIPSNKIKTPVLRWMLLWLLVWIVSVSVTHCRVVSFHDIGNERIHHHNDKVSSISSVKNFVRLPLDHHKEISTSSNDVSDDVDADHSASLNDIRNMKAHGIMVTDSRSLQLSSFNCVHDETEFKFAIISAPDFSSTSTRIDLCSPYIFINASQPNLLGLQGLFVQNKSLEIHCNVSDSVKKCTLDSQHLSRMFYVLNSTLVFHDVDFINSNATKDSVYSNGGAFYVNFSKIKMIHCGFLNNMAKHGGGMHVSGSTVTIMEDAINKIPIIMKNNKAVINGGFIDALNSTIYLQKCNIVNNTAAYGGAVCVWNSSLTLVGSDEKNSPTILQNNYANKSGACIYADDASIVEIRTYNIINNTATYGGALCIINSSLTLIGSDDPTLPSVAQNHLAFQFGGFIVANNSMLDIRKYNIINNNAGVGGALYLINSVLKLIGSSDSTMPTLLEKNVAIVSGGAILAKNNSTIMTTQGYFLFRYNVAVNWGAGAVYVLGSTATLTNTVFENNIGNLYGGAIVVSNSKGRAEETSIIFMKNVVLSNNTSLNGTIAIQETKISLEKVSFSRSGHEVYTYDLLVSTYDEDNNKYRPSQVNFPNSPPPQKEKQMKQQKENPVQQQTCLTSRSELEYAVNNCNLNESRPACSITICGTRLQIDSSNNSGINISNKKILLKCQKACPTHQCILDGMGVSRIFYGSNAILTVNDFIFVNGFHRDNGGAIKLDRSVLTIGNCSFVNNTAPFGSAVTVNNSRLSVEGVETRIVNNTGSGPPIEVLASQFTISNAVFAGNKVSKYDSAILLYNSSIEVYNVHVVKSQGRQQRIDLVENGNFVDDCDVYVATFADDFDKKLSCLKFDNSSNSFPIVVLSDDCTTSSPGTTTPTPTPTPTPPSPKICFSGENLVEIKEYGHIRMSQLRIGDFVKSSGDKFSQVYGFGHFNHDQEGTYLRITFDTNYNNHSPQVPEYFIEISPRHLLMMEKNEIPIPATDVVVGDILSGKKVIEIQAVIRRGVYAPLTQSGDIVVSGILASNYVNTLDCDMNQHMFGHFLFTPQRVFCQYHMDTCMNEIYINGYGILAYFIVLGSWIINRCRSICQLYLQCFKYSFGFFFPTTVV